MKYFFLVSYLQNELMLILCTHNILNVFIRHIKNCEFAAFGGCETQLTTMGVMCSLLVLCIVSSHPKSIFRNEMFESWLFWQEDWKHLYVLNTHHLAVVHLVMSILPKQQFFGLIATGIAKVIYVCSLSESHLSR
jgi:hypothetical protein